MGDKKALLFLTFYFIILGIVATSLNLAVTGGISLQYPSLLDKPNILEVLGFVWDMLKMFFGFFIFSIEGVSPIITILFFWLPALPFIFYIIGLVRGSN